jgi:hypothetical protein
MLREQIIVGISVSLIAYGIVAAIKWPHPGLIGAAVGIALLLCLHFYHRNDLAIHYAGHGIGDEQYADVTKLLRGYVRNNQLNIVIDGTTFPDDPYPGKKKHILVKYSYGSKVVKEKIRHDGDRLTLP